MKSFKKVLKNKLFYLIFLLGVFVIPIFKFNLQAQEDNDYVNYSNKNLASPDLEGKEYLGEGVYRLYNENGITIDYNVDNGIYAINGTAENSIFLNLSKNITLGELTAQMIVVSGSINTGASGWRFINDQTTDGRIYWNGSIGGYIKTNIKTDNINDLKFHIAQNDYFDNFRIKLQLEKGDTATPYTVPLQPYLWHEKRLSYNLGFSDGYNEGYNDGESDGLTYGYNNGYDSGYNEGYDSGYNEGYNEGYDEARVEYGIYIGGEWVNATDYGELQYNEARGEYGIFINGEWVSAVDYGELKYDDGYQDGVSDTHDYYDDNGLFIPTTIPKAHIVLDYDLRYGEPYFYLQDFYNVDDVYFGFQHNRWLEKAFDWAYDNEIDFLAINDLYAIKYQSDETLYTYFFYKYDTDSIYFYNDNGTLLKIVERVDFDYYVYEVPELTQEEQARIDNAYNKGMRDYGYYDSESEEYLTAVEYGDIQYNLGVQSTRDRAYLDGFTVGLWDSHRYGFDWVRATYYELIAERPVLNTLSDQTSFAYQKGYDKGYDDGDNVGYNRGYDWGYDDGKIDGIDIGYNDGYNDGEEVGYDKGYEVAVNNTYDAIYDDIYNIGYKDGQKTGMNNKFYSGLEKWIVPAIIVVLFFGLLMIWPKNKED